MVKVLDEFAFLRIVKKYDGDKYVKHFSCWNQLLTLMFGQLTGKPSLRRFILASKPIQEKFYDLGLGKNVTRSNLSKANNNRDYHIFEDFAYHMVRIAQKKRITDIFKLGGKVYAFDSTTIDLCLSVYEWAHFRHSKGGVKVHTLFDLETQVPTIFHITKAKIHDVNGMDVIPYEPGSFYVFDRAYGDFRRLYHVKEVGSYFVVRAKKPLRYRHVRWKRRMPKNILSDSIIRLTVYKSKHDYPAVLRRIEYYDEDQDRIFVFLTNALSLDSLQVANLYKSRWKIELFFKWMKQHLNIQRFWGETENAVRIQIYAAITAYCMVAIIQHDTQTEMTIYEVLETVSMVQTEKSQSTTFCATLTTILTMNMMSRVNRLCFKY
jgi:hypothetical protein